jgi:hypothetical protein
MPRFRRARVLTVCFALAIVGWYVVRFDGEPRPVDPLLVVQFGDGAQWLATPLLMEKAGEPEAVYVVPGSMPADGGFDAVRVSVPGGTRRPTRITIGPESEFAPFESAELLDTITVDLSGVTLSRPTFHLFTFPGNGGGPGLHVVESATGVARLVARTPAGARPLLARTVINSNTVHEMKSLASTNRAGSLAAFLWRAKDGWSLYVFSLDPGRKPH